MESDKTKPDPSAEQPLAGVKVLELSTMVTASLATMIMASQGAEVIKVEPVGIGDPMRYIGSQKLGISGLFANCNRGKRSIAVDLKNPKGQDLIRRLACEADVLVHNYRTGVMDRLSLGSEGLRAQNPKLVFAAINGFGTEGPMADDPAYDHVIQAIAGYTGVQGSLGSPEFMRTLVADKITAYTAAQGITAALLARASTGVGQHIDLSMLQACVFFLFPDGMMAQTLKADDVFHLAPMSEQYRTIQTSDGHIAIVAGSDEHFKAVTDLVDRPDIRQDERFSTPEGRGMNIAALLETLDGAFSHIPTEQALAKLKEGDVPCAPCLTPDDVLEHEQVKAVGAVSTSRHPFLGDVLVAEPPLKFGGKSAGINRPCPALGEHTREVSLAAGLDATEIANMYEAGALG